MSTIKSFEDLRIWQKSRELSKAVYQLILSNSDIRDFPLKDQLNGSSGSIMDNIAEGFGRGGNKEFIIFLAYANGSADELRSQLYRSFDRKYLSNEQFDSLNSLALEISRMTIGLIAYLRKSDMKGPKFMARESETYYGLNPPEEG